VRRQLGRDAGLGAEFTKEDYLAADGSAMSFSAGKTSQDPTLVTEEGTMQINWAPFEDGNIIPYGGPKVGVEQGLVTGGVPLLTGWNADEWRLFMTLPADIFKIPDDEEEFGISLHKFFRRRFHTVKSVEATDAPEVWQKLAMALIRIYKDHYPEMSHYERGVKLIGEFAYGFPSLDMGHILEAAGAPVYYYTLGLEAANGLGACHGVDISLVFGIPYDEDAEYEKQFCGDALKDEVVRKATDTVMDAWTSFAKSGSPNQPDWVPSTSRLRIAQNNTACNKVVRRDLPTYQGYIAFEREMMDEVCQKRWAHVI
jgi:para-nitrobenzyl esterase